MFFSLSTELQSTLRILTHSLILVTSPEQAKDDFSGELILIFLFGKFQQIFHEKLFEQIKIFFVLRRLDIHLRVVLS